METLKQRRKKQKDKREVVVMDNTKKELIRKFISFMKILHVEYIKRSLQFYDNFDNTDNI